MRDEKAPIVKVTECVGEVYLQPSGDNWIGTVIPNRGFPSQEHESVWLTDLVEGFDGRGRFRITVEFWPEETP